MNDVRARRSIVYFSRRSAAESRVQGKFNFPLESCDSKHSDLGLSLPSKVKADLNTTRINPSPQDRSKEGSASTHESHRNVLAKQPPGQVGPSASSSHSAVRESSPSTRARAESRLFPPSNSLQPLSLLNARALEGEFSLDNILSTKESGQQGMSQNLAPMHGDPIIDGLISYHVGASLFHGYVDPSRNPHF